jgi:hypothetical protein
VSTPNYVVATKFFVDAMASDLHDPTNQGPRFTPHIFPIGKWTAAFLRGDEVIGASEEDLQSAAVLARETWAAAWGLDHSELDTENT